MANDVAHEGIRKILDILDEAEVKQLACTTTQNNIKFDSFNTKEDAVETIIRYSSDYSTILNRKCIRRDILFEYCHTNNIFIVPPITKLGLIQKILDYWSNTSNIQQTVCEKTVSQNEYQTNNQESENNEEVNTMAMIFTKWFYEMLNADEYMNEEHFWQDCSLQINLISPDNHVETSVESDRTQVVISLFTTKKEHGLYFNPNLTSDGVNGKMDVHGLVMIFVCGTLHVSEKCVGIFEQVFSLVRDPFCDNNWKIKNTRINLKSKNVIDTPRLCDSEFNNDL